MELAPHPSPRVRGLKKTCQALEKCLARSAYEESAALTARRVASMSSSVIQ